MAAPTVNERMKAAGIVLDPQLVVTEARNAGLRLALACALLEQESGGGHNIFGHDRDPRTKQLIFPAREGTVPVTKELYHKYLKHRKATGQCQGVGPTQLTFFALQDEADAAGGCWKPEVNLRIGFRNLGRLVKANGEFGGLVKYNGATAYATNVLAIAKKWEAILAGAEVTTGLPILRRGDRGQRVRKLTHALSYVHSRATKAPYLDGRRNRFDAATESALKAFQREHHLGVDGKFGSESARALRRAVSVEQKRRALGGHVVTKAKPVHRPQPHRARPRAVSLPALVRELRRLDEATGEAWDSVVAFGRRRERLLARLVEGTGDEPAIVKSLSEMTAILLRIESKVGEIAELEKEEESALVKTTAEIEHETAELVEKTTEIAASVAGEGGAPPSMPVVQAQAVKPPPPEGPAPTPDGGAPPAAPLRRRLGDLTEMELLQRIARLDRALDHTRAEVIRRYAKVEEEIARRRPEHRRTGNGTAGPAHRVVADGRGKRVPDADGDGGRSATTRLGDRGILVRRSKVAISRYLRAKGSPEHVKLRRVLRREARAGRRAGLATPVWQRGVKAVQHLAGRPVTGEMDGDLVRLLLPFFPGDNAGKKVIRATPAWRLIPGQLSPNFNLKEVACKDAAHTQYVAGLVREKGLTKKQAKHRAKELAKRLERLRTLGGDRPLHITSGYRTEAYNATLKGAVPNSAHTRGYACDTPPPPGVSLLQHEQHALKAFECGVGYYPGNLGNFIHGDFDRTLGGRRRWGPGRG